VLGKPSEQEVGKKNYGGVRANRRDFEKIVSLEYYLDLALEWPWRFRENQIEGIFSIQFKT